MDVIKNEFSVFHNHVGVWNYTAFREVKTLPVIKCLNMVQHTTTFLQDGRFNDRFRLTRKGCN